MVRNKFIIASVLIVVLIAIIGSIKIITDQKSKKNISSSPIKKDSDYGLKNKVINFPGNFYTGWSLKDTGSGTPVDYYADLSKDNNSNITFRTYNLKLNVTKYTVLDYWINPEEDNGRYVAIDIHCTDGTTLKDSDAVDQYGYSLNPSAGHGKNIPLNAWSQINSNIGNWLQGKVIDSISIQFQRQGASGEVKGCIDNISISDYKTFATGFEADDVQPPAFDYPDMNNNITGYEINEKATCRTVTKDKAHSGENALRYAGTAVGDKANNIMYRLFEERINVDENTVLSYWIYPEQENGRYAGIDLICTDGTTLRGSNSVDQNGFSMHPSAGHGEKIPLNQWTEITCNIGQKLKGKTIDIISLMYEKNDVKGKFSGYLDDIKVYNTKSDAVIAAGDPDINYVGRWDTKSSSIYKSYFGGAYFKVNFTGKTAKIKLDGQSDIYVKIDDGDEVLYKGANGIVNITPSSLEDKEHSLMISARSQYDSIRFQGLILDNGASTKKPLISKNLIEFIGDSITEGYTNKNETLSSYAFLTGEKLKSEHTQIAYAGICLSDNVNYFLNHNIGMNTTYFKLQPTEKFPNSPDWNFNRYSPNMIVINLGTNDCLAKVLEPNFEDAYKTFLKKVRDNNKDAEIFVLRTFGSPTYKDGFYSDATKAAVDFRINEGDKKIHYIDTKGWVTEKSSFSDGLHPSEKGHKKIAEKLVNVLEPYLIN